MAHKFNQLRAKMGQTAQIKSEAMAREILAQDRKEKSNNIDLVNLTDDERELLSGLPVCGCGCPDDAYRFILNILYLCSVSYWDELRKVVNVRDNVRDYIILCALSDGDYIEHGSVIDYPWLTDKGEAALKVLLKYWGAAARHDRNDGKEGII